MSEEDAHDNKERNSMSEVDASILDGKTIIALLVGAVQAEKFCDGAFLGLLKQGCIIRWLGKLEVIDNRKKIEILSRFVR